jgi:hypothetical protein
VAARVVTLTFPVDFIDYGYRIFAMVDNLLSQRRVVRLLSYMTPDERERYALAEKVEIDERRRRQEASRLDPQTLAWLPFEDRMAWVKAETESIARLVAAGETRMEILMGVIDRELRRQPPVPDFEI